MDSTDSMFTSARARSCSVTVARHAAHAEVEKKAIRVHTTLVTVPMLVSWA
jgi:hypothetical protein